MSNQINFDEKRRLIISILTQYHGVRTLEQLNGEFFELNLLKIEGIILFWIFLKDEFIEYVGQPIAASKEEMMEQLARMPNVIKFEGGYLTTSAKSAHICRRLD